jgi:small subunit ribosomal protein S11
MAENEAKKPAEATKEGAVEKKKVKKSAKTKRKSVPEAHFYIHAGYNNTLVSVAEPNGDVLAWASSGSCGFKGARKSTPYAAQVAAETAAEKSKIFGLERVHVFVKGAGPGREQALRGIINGGLSIESITDTTGVPHNGCRTARSRRV